MASCILELLNAGRAGDAAPLACKATQGAQGDAFFQLNALAATALAKADKCEASLEYWDRIVRSAPQKLNYLEAGLRAAWQMPDLRQRADYEKKWRKMLANVYTAYPSSALLLDLEKRGEACGGAIGIQDGRLCGWLWINENEQPKIEADLPRGCVWKFGLKTVGVFGGKTLYAINTRLPDVNEAFSFRLYDGKGNPVNGSPIICSPAKSAIGKKRKNLAKTEKLKTEKLTILIPVYGDYGASLACIGTALASLKKNRLKPRVLVAYDNGPDANLLKKLRRLAARGKIRLLENPVNMGFLASVNNAIDQISDGDIILLNSDTIVHGDWIDRLARASQEKDAATVTALSNEAELMSYPAPTDRGKIKSLAQIRILDKAAAKIENPLLEIPVGVGFCMLITRRCINAIGGFDGTRIFRGYGEEVDYCLRASEAGLKNFGAFNVFVGHLGERSFGAAKKALASQNNAAIFEHFPAYRRDYEIFLMNSSHRKLREGLSRQILADLPRYGEIELRPWSCRYLPPWTKDERCEASREGAVLFIQAGPWPRAILRVWSKIPIAEMNFDLPGDWQILACALRNLGAKIGVDLGCPKAALEIASELGLEIKKPAFDENAASLSELPSEAGDALVVPPATLKGWKNLLRQAKAKPEAKFHVFFMDSLWSGAPHPPNMFEVPLVDDYRILSPQAMVLADRFLDYPAWRHWLDAHSCADLPFYRLRDV